MTKRDYEAAARIVQLCGEFHEPVMEAFIDLFHADSSSFDEVRFRCACVPKANVKARPK